MIGKKQYKNTFDSFIYQIIIGYLTGYFTGNIRLSEYTLEFLRNINTYILVF